MNIARPRTSVCASVISLTACCRAGVVGRHACRVLCKCGGWQAEQSSSDVAGGISQLRTDSFDVTSGCQGSDL